MTFKEDITRRVNIDFGDKANQAFEILHAAIQKTAYLKTERVIRCIVFLAKGNIDELNLFIQKAIFDTRDVMLLAEYEELDSDLNYKRLRNFNRTFEMNVNPLEEDEI